MLNSVPQYGKVFTLLQQACADEWQQYVNHQFVQSLIAGTLPKRAFLHYLQQDYLYLIHHARAWALAVTKAESLQEMKLCASTVDTLINQELSLHIQICAQYGIDEATLFNSKEELETTAYTRCVLDAGLQGDFLDLVLALAPCSFGYGEIALNLQQVDGDHPYQHWLNTYRDPTYQAVCQSVGQLLDSAMKSRVGEQPQQSPRWHRMLGRFSQSVQLETAFWQMGLNHAI